MGGNLPRAGASPLGHVGVAGEDSVELPPRGDVELRENLSQVVLDGAPAYEQPRADLGVGEAVAGEPGDLGLLGGEPAAGLDGAFAGGLARGPQLVFGTLREPFGAHRVEHLERGAQLLASVHAPALASQPFAVEEVGAGE